MEELAGKKIKAIYQVDLTDEPAVLKIMEELRGQVEAVMHFAGLKAVGESVARPLDYYRNNVGGTCSLLKAMQATGVKDIVFSSSATVYGLTQQVPPGGLDEGQPTGATNPYGRTKLFIEEILRDMHTSDPSITVVIEICSTHQRGTWCCSATLTLLVLMKVEGSEKILWGFQIT